MFKKPHLVQRLNKPRNPGTPNPFTFGGGLRHGGLNEETARDLSTVFDFEYMGAAEYEFGAVPKALSSIWEAGQKGDLEAWEFEVPATSIKIADWMKHEGWVFPETQTVKVYALAPKELKGDVEMFVRETAKKDKTRDECVMFWRAFTVKGSDPYKLGGWLELDNGFMFFADRTMWEQMTVKMGGKIHA
jgi:hypothetical protein